MGFQPTVFRELTEENLLKDAQYLEPLRMPCYSELHREYARQDREHEKQCCGTKTDFQPSARFLAINLPFSPISPIRTIQVGSEEDTINIGKDLLSNNLLCSFPVVSKGSAMLRICISAAHTYGQIRSLVSSLKDLFGASTWKK